MKTLEQREHEQKQKVNQINGCCTVNDWFDSLPDLMKPSEVAFLFRMETTQITNRIHSGKIAAIELPGYKTKVYRITKEEVRRLLSQPYLIKPKKPRKEVVKAPKRINVPTFTFHPFTSLFKPASEDRRAIIFVKLQDNGFDINQPIVLYNKQILIGRLRYEICKTLNIRPVFKTIEKSNDALAILQLMNSNKHREIDFDAYRTIKKSLEKDA